MARKCFWCNAQHQVFAAAVGGRKNVATRRCESEPPRLGIKNTPLGAAEGVDAPLMLEREPNHVMSGHVGHFVGRETAVQPCRIGSCSPTRASYDAADAAICLASSC